MIHYKRFPIEPYKDALYLFCPCTQESAEAWVKRRKLRDVDLSDFNECDGLTFHTMIGNLTFLHEFNDTPDGIGVLGHELVHVTFNVLNERGVKEEQGNEEAAAYLLDSLLSRTLRWLRAQAAITGSDVALPPEAARSAPHTS